MNSKMKNGPQSATSPDFAAGDALPIHGQGVGKENAENVACEARAQSDTPRIEHIAVSKLTPYARNSRTHSPQQIAQVAASIQEFGFTNPVLIDSDGGIIAGHGRVMAAQSIGLDRVPCIRLAHLSDAQKRAYIIADNKLALNAGWDENILALELKDLGELGFDLELTGFELSDITGELKHIQQVTIANLQALEQKTDHEPASEKAFEKEMDRTDTAGLIPIVPMYAEHHEAFIILSDNTIDEAWLRNKLGLDVPHQSYKDIKAMRPNVITVQQFRERIGA